MQGNSNYYNIKEIQKVLCDGPSWKKAKILWSLLVVSMHNICLFLAVLQRLAPCDRMQMIGFHQANACCLCPSIEETTMHLFFSCAYSRQVQKGIFEQLDVQIFYQQEGIQLWLLQNRFVSAIRSYLLRAIMVVVVSGISNERNMRIFKNQH